MAPKTKGKKAGTDSGPKKSVSAPKSSGGEKKAAVLKSTKAGIVLSVSKVNRKILQNKAFGVKRVGATSPIYIAAAAEYLASQIFEQAHEELKKEKGHKKRVTPAHIMAGIRNDKELNKALAGLRVLAHDKIKQQTKWLMAGWEKDIEREAKKAAKAAAAAAEEEEEGDGEEAE